MLGEEFEAVYGEDFRVSEDGELTIGFEVRERHFNQDEEPETCLVHPVGDALYCTVWSSRDTIKIRLPFREWCAGEPVERSLTGMRVNISKWAKYLDAEPEDDHAIVHGYVGVLTNDWKPPHLNDDVL